MKRLVAVVALVGVAGCAREDWRALAPPEGVNAEVAVGTMTTVRAGHTATLLQDGTVLAVGGFGSWYLDTSETFDPATGNWTPRGNLVVSRQYHTATLLGSGKVLIVGGYGDGGATLATELYDPTTGLFRQTAGRLVVGRAYHTATLLRDGRVLVVGGNSGSSAPAEVEIFDPADESWSAGPALGSPRLTTVPRAVGQAERLAEDLNPIPHPFP